MSVENSEMGPFASTIVAQKYAQTKENGSKETWEEIAQRVAKHVLGAVNAPQDQINETAELISERKFIPGGRYLYASGRPFHQVQNCFEGSTRIITREGTKELRNLTGTTPVVMTTEGHWVRAEVRSFGEQPLLRVVLCRQGIVKEILATKDHSWRVAANVCGGRPGTKTSKTTGELRNNDKMWQVFGYGISRTPVSPAGVQHGIVYGDGNVPGSEHGFNTANVRLCGEKDSHLIPYFRDYSSRIIGQDTEISGLPRRFKSKPSLLDDRSYLLGWLAGYFAADGCVSKEGTITLASADRDSLEFVRDVCYLLGIGSFGIRENNRISNLTNEPHLMYSIAFMRDTLVAEFFLLPIHRVRFEENSSSERRQFWNVVSVEETNRVEEVFCAVVEGTHEFVLEDNILTGNCLLLRAEDSREGWADLLQKASMALMTGAGIGVDYSAIRAEGSVIKKTGGFATGPNALAQILNEAGRGIMQGGSRRSAIWAGLNWAHPDIHKFITMKNWSPEVRKLKEQDFNFPATMDGTNISVQLDDAFFDAYYTRQNPMHEHACLVYWSTVRQMLETAEPGFAIDCGENAGETLRNACCEITSHDDSDICNLGSINMARIESLEEMTNAVKLATAFLMAGTVYSDIPYERVGEIREKNRRLGLGLMGLHEWMLKRGLPYGPSAELAQYMEVYQESKYFADHYARLWDLSVPVKTRAIAPTGTIGIVAETSGGLEPLFCVAYKRRYLKASTWHYQYVVDPTAKRLVEEGVDPDSIEDAYALAEQPERRVAFQAWLQQYVDHAISSTLNLPAWGTEFNNEDKVQEFGNMLIGYLPKLRGFTCYPDGARSGQPITPVKWSTAMKHVGEIFIESGSICDLTKGGSCGS